MDMDEAMEKSVYIAGVTPVDDDFDLKDFTHIRAYHSCRPISIDRYKKQGICPLTYESAKSDLLLKLQNAGIPEATLIEIFDKHWDDLGAVHQGVWFTLTKEELLELLTPSIFLVFLYLKHSNKLYLLLNLNIYPNFHQ